MLNRRLCCVVNPVNSCCRSLCKDHFISALNKTDAYIVMDKKIEINGFSFPIKTMDYVCPVCGKIGSLDEPEGLL